MLRDGQLAVPVKDVLRRYHDLQHPEVDGLYEPVPMELDDGENQQTPRRPEPEGYVSRTT